MTHQPDCNCIKTPYLDSKVILHPTTPSLIKRTVPKILKLKNSLLFTIIFVAFAQVCWGQDEVGDYRSKVSSGNWSSLGSWETCTVAGTPGTWGGVPTTAPLSTNSVTILKGHTITLNISIGYVNDITIYGTLKFSNAYTLSVNGSFCNNGTFTQGSSTVLMNGIGSQNITGLAVTNFYNLTIANSNSPVTASKSFIVFNGMVINANCTFIPDATVIIGSNSHKVPLTVLGTLKVTASNLLDQYSLSTTSFNIGEIEYSGSSVQDISTCNYYALKINNVSGCYIQQYDQPTCSSLNISNGTLTVTPQGSLKVSGNTYLENFECLVLQSFDALSIGTYIYNSISGSGNIKVERFMSQDDSWHLYCSPVSNQSIHSFLYNNLDIPTLMNGSTEIGVGMDDYDTLNDQWKLYPISNPINPYLIYINKDITNLQESMGGGKGFIIRTIPDNSGTGTLYATGIPNALPVATGSTITGGNGWNCLGNPFTCALDVPLFISTNKTLINQGSYKFLYLWDPNLLDVGIGGYTPVGNGNVPTGQGFFIKSSGVSGSLSFTSGMMKSNIGLPFKNAEPKLPLIRLVVVSQKYKSATDINFNANTTKGLDPGYDAGMLKADKDFALYSRLLEDNGVDFCLQCLPDQNFDQYVIPIGIDFKAGGDLTFTAETVNLPVGCLAVLEDRLTKQFTRLDLKDAKYTATVSANTKGTGRFYLHTSDVISGDQPIEKEPFRISKIGKTLYINGEVSDKANFFVYSVNGKLLANFKSESQVQNQFDASGLPAGVYILTCDDQNQKKSIKFVIEN